MSKLLSQGGFGCVFYPGITCEGKTDKSKSYVSKLQIKDETTINELEISKIVESIRLPSPRYAYIESHCNVDLKTINRDVISKCDVLSNDKEKYILMRSRYINNQNFFSSLTSDVPVRYVILQMLETYIFLVSSIKLLVEKRIIHFDFTNNNIIYSPILLSPILIDFGISIDMNNFLPDSTVQKGGDLKKTALLEKKNKFLKDSFYIYAPDVYIWPLEVHLICYLVNESDKLTLDSLKAICSEYVVKNVGFKIFSEHFKKQYVVGAVNYYKKFIKKSKDDIIEEFISYWETWDNYALGILNLRFLRYIFQKSFFENNLIVNLSQIALQNCHYNPNKRETIEETLTTLNKVFFTDSDPDKYINLVTNITINSDEACTAIKQDKLDIPVTETK